MDTTLLKKRSSLYLAIIFGLLAVGWIVTLLLPNAYTVIWGLFSVFPILATVATRLITKDRSPWYLKPNFRMSWKTYLVAAFAPGVAIFLGGLLYFTLFPQDLDLGAHNLIAQYGQYGAPETIHFTAQTVVLIGLAFIVISPLVLPVYIFALGEEIGWRGYLLPILLKLTSPRKAILLHGLLWGLAHAPLIYFGFNYGSNYWGAPWSGILMMTLVCIVLGIWLAYVTIRSESILPAVIFHGAGNVIGEMAALVSFVSISPLLGPNPTGLIGMSGLFLGAMFLLMKLEGKKIMKNKSVLLEMIFVMSVTLLGMWFLPAYKTIFALIPVAYLLIERRLRQRTWADLGFSVRTFWADLRANWVLFVLVGFIMQPVTALWAKAYFPEFLAHVQARLPFESGIGWGVLLPLLAVSLLGEEMTYRTLLQGRLALFIGAPAAVGVGSVLFGLAHIAPGAGLVVLVDVALIVVDSILYGTMFARRNNLWVVWLAHLLGDIFGLLVLSSM